MPKSTLFLPMLAMQKVNELRKMSIEERKNEIENICKEFPQANSMKAILNNIANYEIDEHDSDDWVLNLNGLLLTDTAITSIQQMLGSDGIQQQQVINIPMLQTEVVKDVIQQLCPFIQQQLQSFAAELQRGGLASVSENIARAMVHLQEQRRTTLIQEHNIADGTLPQQKRPRLSKILCSPKCDAGSMSSRYWYVKWNDYEVNLTYEVIMFLRLPFYAKSKDRIRDTVMKLAHNFFRAEYASLRGNAIALRQACKSTQETPILYTKIDGADRQDLLFAIVHWLVVNKGVTEKAPVWPLTKRYLNTVPSVLERFNEMAAVVYVLNRYSGATKVIDPTVADVPESALAQPATEEVVEEYKAYYRIQSIETSRGEPSRDVITVLCWPEWVHDHWPNLTSYTHAIFFSGTLTVTTEVYLAYLRVLVIFYDIVGPDRAQTAFFTLGVGAGN